MSSKLWTTNEIHIETVFERLRSSNRYCKFATALDPGLTEQSFKDRVAMIWVNYARSLSHTHMADIMAMKEVTAT